MALKCHISSPLEAGTSILDAHHLPLYLTQALEYTSKRLARKGLHVTLVVVRRDYQLPNLGTDNDPETLATSKPVTNLPTPPVSPTSPDVVPRGPGFGAIKSLARSSTYDVKASPVDSEIRPPQRSKTLFLSKKASLASLFDGGLGSPRLRWPLTPHSPSCFPRTPRTPTTPNTPATPASSVTTASTTAMCSAGAPPEQQGVGVRLIHTTPLTPRAEKLLNATLALATRKFNLSTPLTAHYPSTYNIPKNVLYCSILQNELLFSSEGLTLLSLDHLYTFKGALSHYATGMSEPGSDFRLEDAVDELRRYILSSAGGRRKLLKSVLIQTFDRLSPMNDAALDDVMRMYCRAYGGVTGDTGVENDMVKFVPDKMSEEGTGLRTMAPTPPPKSAARTRMALTTTTMPPTPLPENEQKPQLPHKWVVADYSPKTNEGHVDISEASTAKDETKNPAEENTIKKGGDEGCAKTTTAPEGEQQEFSTLEQTPKSLLQNLPRPSPHNAPSPRRSQKTLPTLKLQTSFTEGSSPRPKRKGTPVPKFMARRRKPDDDKAAPPSPQCTDDKMGDKDDIKIEFEIGTDDDDNNITEFEDGDLTARPPPTATKTPSAAFWLGGSIDEILGSRPRQRGSGSTGRFSSHRHHKRSSSLLERMGPTTPNGYDDISPITRGEWGFLMVSDPFKTKTAAVETC